MDNYSSEVIQVKPRKSFASRLSNAVKLPLLNVSSSNNLTHGPMTPLDQELFGVSVSMNHEDYDVMHPIGM